ncbi:MAG TPA: hypothetical protein VIT02_10350 [Burkholderiaceae bacterium]
MYIVAIGWIYVVALVALTQPTWVRALATFLLAGLAPLALWLWLVGTPQRRRNRARAGDGEADAESSGSVDPDH